MAVTENFYTGNGSTTSFSLTFEYLEEDDVKVTLDEVITTAYSFANATTILFNTAPANGVAIRIYRDTDIDDLKSTFFAGSSIRAQDLNNNFLQNNFAVQELKNNTWDKETSTIHSDEAWVSVDTQVATTAAMDAQFWNQTSETINNAEQIAGSPAPTDSNIFTALAAANRFDTLVQVATPTGTDWEVGKTWLQNDDDKTVSIWNGSAWVPVASGGAFTELPKVVYVDSVNGDDSLAGHRISNPKRTIKAAIDAINADVDGDGSIVVVAPGIYGEEFPIDIQKNDIGIVGQSIRNCIIHPAIGVTPVTSVVIGQTYRIRFIGTTDFIAMGAAGDVNNPPAVGDTFTATAAGTGTGRVESIAIQTAYDVNVPEPNELATMFRVNSGTYLYGLTLQGMKASGARGGNSLDTDATYGLPTNQGWNFSFYPGALIKKSPYIQNCTNFSDSQINNVTFTPHIPGEGAAGDLDSAPTGGGILINGNTPAANSPLRSMVTDSYTHTALNGPGIFVTNNGYCQATSSYSFFGHYHLKTKNGGQANLAASTTDFGSYSLIADGRSTNPIFTATTTAIANSGSITFTIGAPVAGSPWHGSATRPQDNMLVDIGGNTYPVLSATANGAGWNVTISRPDPNNFNSNLGLINTVNSGSAVSFYLRSMIASSGHTMEYVGSGNDYTALPENGGVPDDTKQVIELNNGKIWAAITDHRGTFKVGNTFKVNQQTGFVTIDASASNAVTKTSPTGSAIIPLGTNAQRDASPSSGYLRFNTTSNSFEGYNGSSWGPLATTSSTVTDGDYGDITVSGSGTIWNIDAGVVGATELASDSVTTAKIAADAVTTAKIADDAVTAAKLADTAVTPGSYGSTTNIPSITVDAQGRITAASNNAFTAGATSLDGLSDAKTVSSGTSGESLFIGTNAGNSTSTGNSDIGIGYDALGAVATADNNIGIGQNALRNSNGLKSIGIGTDAGRYQAGSFGTNISIGYEAGKGVSGTSTGYQNTLIGYRAGVAITTGNSNHVIGYNAGNKITTGSQNVAIGNTSGGASATTTTGDSNISVGPFAGAYLDTGNTNTLVGRHAGYHISTGSNNVGLGHQALGNTASGATLCTGSNNVAIGYLTLTKITTGSNNVCINEEAGKSITTATDNILIGYIAGRVLTTGSLNVAIGAQALPAATTGNRNIAIGYRALQSTQTSSYNVAIGWTALTAVTTGLYNVAVGQDAGNLITTGASNTCIGDLAGDLITTGSNNTCLGNGADPSTATVSNEVVLGNASVATLRCNTQTISSLSDGRDKIEIEDLPVGLEFINSLRPVKFKWDSRDGNGKDGSYDAGFIAQDLQAAQSTSNAEYLSMVVDSNPERLEARYGQLIPVLVQAIKDLKAEIDTLKANA